VFGGKKWEHVRLKGKICNVMPDKSSVAAKAEEYFGDET
jgi:hypothetical protein